MEQIIENALKTLGSRIKAERKAQGMTQGELASLAGVHMNFLSQLEGGKPTVQLDKVLSVLMTLGLELKMSYGKTGIS